MDFYIAIDFDGTIVDKDITDEVIKRFARPGWEAYEEEWEKGVIGSRECLELQMSLIDASLEEVVEFAGGFKADATFPDFIGFLRRNNIPHGVISDGFREFSAMILGNAGLHDVPIFANRLKSDGGRLKAVFPHSQWNCPSGTCKCAAAADAGDGTPVILVGDGRSDFGLAGKAAFVFAKRKLIGYCAENNIAYAPFSDFGEIKTRMALLMQDAPKGMNVLDLSPSL